MRLILLLVSLLLVSYLTFKGYSSGRQDSNQSQTAGEPLDALKRAGELDQLMQDASELKRQQLEKNNQ